MRGVLGILLLLLAIASGCMPAAAEDRLTDDELTGLLYELSLDGDAQSEFLVLPDDYSPPAAGADGVFSLLIIGVDTDNDQLAGRSDTMILASLDIRNASLKMISFMRDLYVTIPGKGHNKLNAAYAFGGPDLLQRTLEQNFSVEADGYLAVNFSAMVDLIDALGGVELTVEDDELRPLNGILEYYNYLRDRPEREGRLASAGTRLLTGLQAMSYARIRKIDSDFERVLRQQRVMEAVFRKLMGMAPDRLADLLIRHMDRVRTDVTMARGISLAAEAFALSQVRVDALRIPVKGAYASKMIRGTYYIVPDLKKNTAAIRDLLAGQ